MSKISGEGSSDQWKEREKEREFHLFPTLHPSFLHSRFTFVLFLLPSSISLETMTDNKKKRNSVEMAVFLAYFHSSLEAANTKKVRLNQQHSLHFSIFLMSLSFIILVSFWSLSLPICHSKRVERSSWLLQIFSVSFLVHNERREKFGKNIAHRIVYCTINHTMGMILR